MAYRKSKNTADFQQNKKIFSQHLRFLRGEIGPWRLQKVPRGLPSDLQAFLVQSIDFDQKQECAEARNILPNS